MFWSVTDNGHNFQRVKLVYSKKGEPLKNILEKYKKLQYNEI